MPGSPETATSCPCPALAFSNASVQHRQFGLAPDQRRHVRRPARFEAACRAAAPDPRHRDWCGKSFYVLIAEVFEFEKIAEQASCTGCHQNLVGLCKLLQTGRQIWRITDQRELAAGAFSDQIADDEPSRWRSQSALQSRATPSNDNSETSLMASSAAWTARSALSSCAAGNPKVGQNAVTHIAADTAVKSEDCDFSSTSEMPRMISRISSGSSRLDSSVEPTMSQKTTVRFRRSALAPRDPENECS